MSFDREQRSFTPYAVDSPGTGDVDRATPGNLKNGALSGSSYENARDATQGAGASTFGIGRGPAYLNAGYERFPETTNAGHHTYEDAAELAEKVKNHQGKRSKRNMLYEPAGPPVPAARPPLGKKVELEEEAAYIVKDSWLSRLVLFLILVISAVALLLVIMIILGKLGPRCPCGSDNGRGM